MQINILHAFLSRFQPVRHAARAGLIAHKADEGHCQPHEG